MAKQLYFEKQDEELQLCGQHALNNLLQGAYFTAFDLGDIGAKLDEEERNLYSPQSPADSDEDSESLPHGLSQSWSNASLYGAFSVEVLIAALSTLDLETMPLSHPQCISAKVCFKIKSNQNITDLLFYTLSISHCIFHSVFHRNPSPPNTTLTHGQDHPEEEEAFLVNLDCHWMCYRKMNGIWYRLDSISMIDFVDPQPLRLTEDLLCSQIEQIQRHRHQIYVIRGELPVDGQNAPKSDELKDEYQWIDCHQIQTLSQLWDRRNNSNDRKHRDNDSVRTRDRDHVPPSNSPSKSRSTSSEPQNQKSRGFEPGIHIKWNIKPVDTEKVNTILSLQNYECGSCRGRLRPNFLSKSNYFLCHYTGSMHCTHCHRGDKAVIPSRIVTALNCKPQSVCVAAKRYLDAMANVPCIGISDFSEHRKVQKNKKMQRVKRAVLELMAMESYVADCESLQILVDGHFEGIRHGLLSWKQCVALLTTDYICKLEAFSERLKAHIIRECDDCRWSGKSLCNAKR